MNYVPDQELPTGESPHTLWKQLLGLIVWTGPLAYFSWGVIGVIVVYTLAGLTFADAWTAGIYKHNDRKSFINISPMGWGIVVPMLLIVAYPVYAINRNKLKTLPGNALLFGSVLVVGGLLLVFSLLGIYLSMTGSNGV